jgi:hypothetical protein
MFGSGVARRNHFVIDSCLRLPIKRCSRFGFDYFSLRSRLDLAALNAY